MNFARFNHVLVPQSAHERLAWLTSKKWRFLSVSFRLFLALTPLGRGVLLLWLFAGALGLNVSDTVCYMMWAVISGMIAASLAVRPWFGMTGVTVSASAPKRVTADKPLEIAITLRSVGEGYSRLQIEAPFLTWDGTYTTPREMVSILPGGQTVHRHVGVKFSARGVHSLMPVMVSRVVPWGIAVGPAVQSGIVEFVVVPRFPTISSLHIPQGTRCQPHGIPLASHMGEALEIGGVRPYMPGDRVRDLHARTWARTGTPHVRQYQQEYFSRVGVILDVNREGRPEKLFEGVVSLCAGVLAHLSNKEALVDVLCVGNQFHELTIGRSLGFFEQALDLLATVEAGEALSLSALESHLQPQLRSLSSVVMVCLSADEVNLKIRDWLTSAGVAVRLLVVQSRTNIAQAGETIVPLSQIQASGEIRL